MQRLINFSTRIFANIAKGINIDAYVIATLGIILAIAGIVGDAIPLVERLQMPVIIAALAYLVLRSTTPQETQINIDKLLGNRRQLNAIPFGQFIHGRRELCMFAPTGSTVFGDTLPFKEGILDRGGSVTVILLDPNDTRFHALAQHQLDYGGAEVEQDMRRTIRALDILKQHGKVQYGFIPFNPGFSLTIVDPDKATGELVVEFHGYRNNHTGERMHIKIKRAESKVWFDYWVGQYRAIQAAAFR
jgi:hypothetical protein